MKTLLKPTEIRALMDTTELLVAEAERARAIFDAHQVRVNAVSEDDASHALYKEETGDLATIVCDLDMALYHLHRLGL